MAERIEKPEQLTAWLEEEDILFRLSLKEAEIILGYLEGSGYSLEAGDGTLFLCDDVNDTSERTLKGIFQYDEGKRQERCSGGYGTTDCLCKRDAGGFV